MFSLRAYEYNQNKQFMRITRRVLRDVLDSFDIPDERFREMYRLPRCLALDFLDMLNSHMENGYNLCPHIPLSVQFCAALNFFASGSYQRRVGTDAFAMMSQTCVSRFIKSISRVIATKTMCDFIKFPQSIEEIQQLESDFQESKDFPGAFAIVDATHIPLAAMSQLIEFAYVNRKGFHSINRQIIVDSRMYILNINARYPGSTHDSLIWGSSLPYTIMRDIFNIANGLDEEFKYFLLGDKGYPLQPWLLRPYDRPCTSTAQEVFNRLHKQLRSLIERVIGLLKARFRCLLGDERKLRYDHLSSGHIIYSCAVLHNFLIDNGYQVDDIEPILDDFVGNFDEYIDQREELQMGQHRRDILDQYFIDNNN